MLEEMRLGVLRYWAWVKGANLWQKALGVGGPLLFLAAIVGAIVDGEEEPAAARPPASIVEATATRSPTSEAPAVLTASDTALEPSTTATRPPTTPTPPPATPTPGVDPAVAAYTAELLPLLGTYADTLTTFSDSMLDAGDNPFLIFTDSWRLDVVFDMALMRVTGDEIRELEPPPCLQDVHGRLLSALDDMDNAFDYLSYGIDHVDVDAIELAAAYMNSGASKVTGLDSRALSSGC